MKHRRQSGGHGGCTCCCGHVDTATTGFRHNETQWVDQGVVCFLKVALIVLAYT